MSFLDNLFSQYGQVGQYASDRMNGKNQTQQQRQWSPDQPSQMLDQVQQPMPSTLMGQMQGGLGGLPAQDNSGQPTPTSLMGQMTQGMPQSQPIAPPESQPVANVQAPQYGDMVQRQEDKNKPMDMQSMMGLLQGGLGSYAKAAGGTGEKGIIGKAFQSYVSSLAGGK